MGYPLCKRRHTAIRQQLSSFSGSCRACFFDRIPAFPVFGTCESGVRWGMAGGSAGVKDTSGSLLLPPGGAAVWLHRTICRPTSTCRESESLPCTCRGGNWTWSPLAQGAIKYCNRYASSMGTLVPWEAVYTFAAYAPFRAVGGAPQRSSGGWLGSKDRSQARFYIRKVSVISCPRNGIFQ